MIHLEALKSSDVDAFLTWAGDPLVTQSLFWDHYSDRQSAFTFLSTIAEPHPWFMAIYADNLLVGAITLDKRQGSSQCRAELGYVIARSHWGKGIATEAAKIALAQGYSQLMVERIEALVDPDNKASIRVLEKAGMKREGLLEKYIIHRGKIRDRYIYAKTK